MGSCYHPKIDRIRVDFHQPTLRLPGNKALELDQVRPLAAEDYEHLHAEAVEQNGERRRIAVMFGPQDGAIDSGTVLEAAREAWYSKFDALYFFGFAIQAKARELVENRGKLKLPCTYPRFVTMEHKVFSLQLLNFCMALQM